LHLCKGSPLNCLLPLAVNLENLFLYNCMGIHFVPIFTKIGIKMLAFHSTGVFIVLQIYYIDYVISVVSLFPPYLTFYSISPRWFFRSRNSLFMLVCITTLYLSLSFIFRDSSLYNSVKYLVQISCRVGLVFANSWMSLLCLRIVHCFCVP
jgi:hypothetical protein